MRRWSHLLPIAALLAVTFVAGCGDDEEAAESGKPFEPAATLTAVGGTQRADKPAFVLRVTARPGDANIRSAAVELPPVVLVDAVAIGTLCAKKELEADRCAGHQRLGFARVESPAFEGGLSGPVYAVSGYGQLPHLAYVLGGPIDLLLEGRITSEGGRIEAGVEDVPDTPMRSFELRIDGGNDGYLLLSRNLCGTDAVADASFISQEGQTHEERVPLRADCG